MNFSLYKATVNPTTGAASSYVRYLFVVMVLVAATTDKQTHTHTHVNQKGNSVHDLLNYHPTL